MMQSESARQAVLVEAIGRMRRLHAEAANLAAHLEGIGAPADVIEGMRAVEARLRALRDC